MDWNQAHNDPNFGAPGDKLFHLGLLAHPYCGDLLRASIYVLLLNPGQDMDNYFGEYMVDGYREALLRTLRQEFIDKRTRFMFLDPEFSWHGGFRWWHKKLVGVIDEVAEQRKCAFAEARAFLGNRLASIELVPYHSKQFDGRNGLTRRLSSATLARDFVKTVVVKRAKAGEAIAIVTRKKDEWDLQEGPGVVVYNRTEAQSAHLSPTSRGGAAILEHLLKLNP